MTIKKYIINTNKINAEQSIKIVLITDLHSHIYGENQSKIANLISKQKPDLIALSGDIADDVVPIEGTEQFLKAIDGIAPVYYVTGNHEFWSNNITAIRQVFRENNVTILEGNFEELNLNGVPVIVGGIDDPDIVKYENPKLDWNSNFIDSFAELKEKFQYKILLSHRPELVELYEQTSFNLVLAGHAHGGQVRIPFILNGMFAPNQGWFPKLAGGLYEFENFKLVVSRGVSFKLKLPRIFNPPEIVVIEIIGQK